MKYLLRIFTILLFIANHGCHAQQLVKTPGDAYKIKENEQKFINKPLKTLLKEIKPEIKMAAGNHGINGHFDGGYFTFKFVTFDKSHRSEAKDETPVTIVVYVIENFEWDYQKRPSGKQLTWTKEDAEKYGDLTVVAFRVYGKDYSTSSVFTAAPLQQ